MDGKSARIAEPLSQATCWEALMPRKVAARKAAWEKSDPWVKLKDWVIKGRGKASKEGLKLQDLRFLPLERADTGCGVRVAAHPGSPTRNEWITSTLALPIPIFGQWTLLLLKTKQRIRKSSAGLSQTLRLASQDFIHEPLQAETGEIPINYFVNILNPSWD